MVNFTFSLSLGIFNKEFVYRPQDELRMNYENGHESHWTYGRSQSRSSYVLQRLDNDTYEFKDENRGSVATVHANELYKNN